MSIRYLKILLILSVALLGLIAFVTNITNLSANYAAVKLILSMEKATFWHGTQWRAVHNPYLAGLFYSLIVLAELAVAMLCCCGAVQMWRRRKAPAVEFNRAKTLALLGCGVGILLWFTGFIVLAGEWFLMWQHRAETLAHAFRFAASIALIMLIVGNPDVDN